MAHDRFRYWWRIQNRARTVHTASILPTFVLCRCAWIDAQLYSVDVLGYAPTIHARSARAIIGRMLAMPLAVLAGTSQALL